MPRACVLVLLVVLILGLAGGCCAAIWYVRPENPHPPLREFHDGVSWDRAFAFLEDALNVAVDGDEVWVAWGEYDVPEPGYCFDVPTGVELYGGFNGTETERAQRDAEANLTVLRGILGAWEATAGGEEGIFTWGNSIISNNKFDPDGQEQWVGIHCAMSSAIIRNNRFTDRCCAAWCENSGVRICNNIIENCDIGVYVERDDESYIRTTPLWLTA